MGRISRCCCSLECVQFGDIKALLSAVCRRCCPSVLQLSVDRVEMTSLCPKWGLKDYEIMRFFRRISCSNETMVTMVKTEQTHNTKFQSTGCSSF